MLGFIGKFWNLVRHPTHSRTTMILLALILLAAVPLTVIISQQQQETRQRASGELCDLSNINYDPSRENSYGIGYYESCLNGYCKILIDKDNDKSICYPKQASPTSSPAGNPPAAVSNSAPTPIPFPCSGKKGFPESEYLCIEATQECPDNNIVDQATTCQATEICCAFPVSPTLQPSPTPTQVRAPVNENARYTPDCEPLHKLPVERCYIMDSNNNNADLNTLLSQGWTGDSSPNGTGTCGSGVSYQMKEPDKFGKSCAVKINGTLTNGTCKWDNNFLSGVCDTTGVPAQSPPTQSPAQPTQQAPAETTTNTTTSNSNGTGGTVTNDLCIYKTNVDELKNEYYSSSGTTLQQVNALAISYRLDTNRCKGQ